ncbi:M56 family metallopeptidase [Colwellia psychrerythraea]|uniref:Peptidase M56 BlaR1 n=1 Tax=Colwellia psychrerythraea TaxID=28229 RepID=A0A099KLS4_COLPS|nr:M56 family metallopeptidase [Colwellia psychrerythraea]KGJ91709.1 peptidase M56 BlaR1 [Colwellia psychrerythraea]
MIAQYTLLTTLALHHIVIGGLLILTLLVLNKVLKTSAEMRSWVLMTAFITSTLVPLTLLSTTSALPVAAKLTSTPASTVINQSAVQSNIENVVAPLQEQTLWHMPSEIVFQFSGILTALVVVWVIGSLWRSLMVFGSFWRTRNLIKSCKAVPQDNIQKLVVDADVEIFTSTQVSSPMVVGLRSPKIILPANILQQLSSEQLAPIVLHELAHIQRNDIWFSHFQEFIAVLFWWSPVIRLLNNKIHIDRELACDLRAVKQLNNNKQYAQSLIDCAKLMITQQRSVLAMGLFSQKKELNNRVSTVLKSKRLKTPSMLTIIGVCLGLSVLTIKVSQAFVPKISINDTRQNAQHYSLLPSAQGEQLIAAVMQNDIITIEHLQSRGVDINTPAIGDGTALIIAVKQDNREMVQALINLGANVNQSSQGDGNPLITAAMTNNITLAQLLIDNGANINGIVRGDETPLINATRRGYFEMTQLLVNHGADVNLSVKTGFSDGLKIRSPLNMSRNSEITNFLIENGAIE